MNSSLKLIARNIQNIPGWHTNRKIVVFESDDWGSIRMASLEAFTKLREKGYPVNLDPYDRYDALESEDDLMFLSDLLKSFNDKNGNTPVFTLNMLMANPDFDKIRQSGYSNYFFEPFYETYKKYPSHSNSFRVLKEGVENRVFQPQFHGREHLNIHRWMEALQKGYQPVYDAFNLGMFSFYEGRQMQNKLGFMDAMNYRLPTEIDQLDHILAEGLELFRNTWLQPSKSFIASCYIWGSDHNKILLDNGIQYFQGVYIQQQPVIADSPTLRKLFHYTGQKNNLNQIYLVRNAFFEPSLLPENDVVKSCMDEVEIAFRWNKPAIICTHRLNYAGTIDPSNRDKNIARLKQLISGLLKRWPEIEFMSSDQLGDLISAN